MTHNQNKHDIPTGTVTFLFTDIEGSTALWEGYPVQMQAALNRHDEIMRAAIEVHGGYVFKTVGDACCAAFERTRDALRAALEAQRALFAESWTDPVRLRVRMALHTGAAEEERDGDYFGPTVNRVARLLSAGHGGQVLLSGPAYDQVCDHPELVDAEASLPDLGEHHLKDIIRPERIHQLTVPDLPERFPPLRTRESSGGPEGERYRLTEFLGSGGMAKVYLAHDEELGRDVAIKVLHPRFVDDEQFVERFKREARSAASLSHSNIVAIYDRGEKSDGAYYIIMEYLSGGTLKDAILKGAPLPARAVVSVTSQVAKALAAAHRRDIIHRDIKPQNILLAESGEAKVADFGIARAGNSTTLTRTGGVMGTPHYIAPEQAEGQPAGPKSDVYALGVVLYEMLTGELPYDANTPLGIMAKQLRGQLRPPSEINPNIPGSLTALTMRLLARDPEYRPDAASLASELERMLRSLEDGGAPGLTETDLGALPSNTITDDVETLPLPEVPDLTGQNVGWAGNALASVGLALGGQREISDTTAPRGVITGQHPPAGARLSPGSFVSVTVSSGVASSPERRRVPILAIALVALLMLLFGGAGAMALTGFNPVASRFGREETPRAETPAPQPDPEPTAEDPEPEEETPEEETPEPPDADEETPPPDDGFEKEPPPIEESAEQEFVTEYYEAVAVEDWATTYSLLDFDSRLAFTEDEWIAAQEARVAATDPPALDSAEIEDISGEGADFDASVLLYYFDGTQETVYIEAAFEDGEYKRHMTDDDISYLRDIAGGEDGYPDQYNEEDPYEEDYEEADIEYSIRAHYAAIGYNDFEEAYSYFGPTYRNEIDESAWISDEESFEIESSTVNYIEIIEVSGDAATAEVDVTFEDNTGAPNFVLTWELVKENGEWKLDEVSSGEQVN
ncbi:MAG: protein kinase domain-containing protein [Rubrobacteraceae bacterium]